MKQKIKREEMKKEVKLSCLLKPVLFIFFAICLEMINFLFVRFKVTGNADAAQILPTYFIIDFAFILMVSGLIFALPRIGQNIVMYLVLAVQMVVNITNSTLYKVFGDIFSFDMMKLGREAAEAFRLDFIEYWSVIVNLLILAVVITVQVIMDRKIKKTVMLKKLSKSALFLVGFFACSIFGISSLCIQTACFKNPSGVNAVAESDEYLWNNMQFKFEAYKKFGTYGFYFKSLCDLVSKNDGFDEELKQEILKDLEEGKKDINPEAKLYGDNLIVIMLESFEWYGMDPINTPTLWRLRAGDAISLENYHSKNKTNMSEDIGILGNMPKDIQMSTLAKSGRLDNPYSLPNLFRELGYTANYFHPHLKTFYDRDIVNAAMGFEYVYGNEDVELEDKGTKFYDWNREVDFVKAMAPLIAPIDKPFFSFYTTVSTHGTWNMSNHRFEPYYMEYDANIEEYRAWLEDNTSYVFPKDSHTQKLLRQYKCAAMDTDRMLEYLLSYLEENNLADNTTIVMYSDHNGYYDNLCFDIKGIKKADFYDTYAYNVPCMIYSKKLGGGVNNSFANTYDLYPTIAELYGLGYNSLMTQGYNIFSSEIENSVMVSYLTGMFNEKIYSLNIVDVYVSEGVTEEELTLFRAASTRFFERQRIIEMIYKYNLI